MEEIDLLLLPVNNNKECVWVGFGCLFHDRLIWGLKRGKEMVQRGAEKYWDCRNNPRPNETLGQPEIVAIWYEAHIIAAIIDKYPSWQSGVLFSNIHNLMRDNHLEPEIRSIYDELIDQEIRNKFMGEQPSEKPDIKYIEKYVQYCLDKKIIFDNAMLLLYVAFNYSESENIKAKELLYEYKVNKKSYYINN